LAAQRVREIKAEAVVASSKQLLLQQQSQDLAIIVPKTISKWPVSIGCKQHVMVLLGINAAQLDFAVAGRHCPVDRSQ